jgi:muramoyltetrapeptide carboxypeptidase
MITPSPLKPGDKIGIVAPSRKISEDELKEAMHLFESWGYEVVPGDNIYEIFHQFAGKDQVRAQDFIQMIQNPEIKAIVCARGGYGTIRLLEELNHEVIRRNPKWIVGYSDITVLHSYFNKVIAFETIHGSMPINCLPETAQNETWTRLRGVMEGKPLSYEISSHGLNRNGRAEGMLVGGNLSVLFSLRGTFCDIDTDGRILFLEDLDEYLYHIDRMMMNLKIAGKLKKLKGIIVGGMSDMKDNTVPFGRDAYEIIADAVSDYDYPVIFNFPAGHCEPNLPLIFGRKVKLDVGEKVNVEFELTR